MARSKPEKVEENKFVAKCRKHKMLAIKLSTQGMYGRRGLNDRCAFAHPRVTVLFEFKRKGQVARKLQKYMHREFKRMDIPCYVVYTCKKAWSLLQYHIKEARADRYPPWNGDPRVRSKKLPARVH